MTWHQCSRPKYDIYFTLGTDTQRNRAVVRGSNTIIYYDSRFVGFSERLLCWQLCLPSSLVRFSLHMTNYPHHYFRFDWAQIILSEFTKHHKMNIGSTCSPVQITTLIFLLLLCNGKSNNNNQMYQEKTIVWRWQIFVAVVKSYIFYKK